MFFLFQLFFFALFRSSENSSDYAYIIRISSDALRSFLENHSMEKKGDTDYLPFNLMDSDHNRTWWKEVLL